MKEGSAPVFLSYASQDAAAVQRIAEALRAVGVEVWFDLNELQGGDAWDAKIRKQIKECALFVPVISAATQARREGYFRLEWKLGAQRTHTMADGTPFLLPVVIDETKDGEALVPEEFRAVQWTRLNLKDTPESLASRVTILLSRAAEPSRSAYVERDETAASRKKSVPRRVRSAWTLFGLIVGVGFAVFPLWNVFRGREKPPAVAAPAAVQISETRKLIAQARALFEDGDESNHENLFLAEDLLKRAVAVDSNDAEAWAAQAQLSRLMIILGSDAPGPRWELWQRQAERAVKLAPDSVEAQVAFAGYLTEASVASAREAIRLLEPLSERYPSHRGILQALGLAYSTVEKPDECAAAFDRANALPGGDHHALAMKGAQMIWHGRYAESESALAGSLALKSNGRAHVFGTMLQLCWRGDLDAAAASLERWPAWLRLEPRGAFIASQVWMWRHEPDKAIAVLNAITRDAWSDALFTGPKSVLLALAEEMAGRPEAARAEWENANKVATRMMTEDPTLKTMRAYKACALARLGQRAEAEAIFRELEQTHTLRAEFWSCAAASALLRIALGHEVEVVTKFDTEVRTIRVGQVYPSPQAALKLNPVFDPIRATPEFQKWQAAAPAPKTNAANGSSAKADARSVAVLAFANLSDDKGNEYFSDGLSEELLNVLAKIPGLKVAARTSAFSFKGRNATVEEIGRTLGVATVVDGSVRKAGNSVRITARLSRAATGEQLWSESYTRDLQDVFAVQSEMAETIIGQLRGQLDGKAREEIRAQVEAAELGGTRNIEAHQLYLQGRYFFNQLGSDNLERAAERLQRAVELDPQFALAWALLSRVGGLTAGFSKNREQTAEGIALARRGAERALAAEPKLASAHLVRSQIQSTVDHDWKGAVSSVQAAQALAPNDPGVIYSAATTAYFLGRPEDAVRLGQQAVMLDPVNPLFHFTLGRAFEALRRFPEAERAYWRFTELSPANAWAYTSIGRVRVHQGRFDEAVIEAEKGPVGWAKLYVLSQARWGQGKTADADALLDQMIKSWAGVADFQIAQIYAFRRENDQAFAWLDRAVASDDQGLAWAKADLTLSALHTDPRWNAFLRKIGLADDQLK